MSQETCPDEESGPFAGGVRALPREGDPELVASFGVFSSETAVNPGLIQVYTGEGKGKTTAAVGLAVRALGQGMRVLLARFLKPDDPASGEILFLRGAPGMDILSSGVGVLGGVSDPEGVARSVRETFGEARRRAAGVDLLILDEVLGAVRRGFLPLADLLDLLDNRPCGVEVVLTGRGAAPEVLERAHLVSRIVSEKHPMDAGISARRGIEY